MVFIIIVGSDDSGLLEGEGNVGIIGFLLFKVFYDLFGMFFLYLFGKIRFRFFFCRVFFDFYFLGNIFFEEGDKYLIGKIEVEKFIKLRG